MEDRTFPAVLRRFDRHLDVIGRSDATRRQYRYELLRWWTDHLFAAELEVADVRPADVEEYLGALPRHGSKRTDANRALRALFSWAHVEGEVDRNPIAHIPIPRPRRGPAPDLSDDDLRRLLRAAFRREPRRGWAILLCYVTGARVGSLVKVRPCDVHLGPDARLDLLEAKGGKPYSVPLERAGVIAAAHLLSRAVSSPGGRASGLDTRSRKSRSDSGPRTPVPRSPPVAPSSGTPPTGPPSGSEDTGTQASESAQPHHTLIGVGAERFRQWVHAAEQEAGLGRVWPHLLRHAFLTKVAHTEGVSPEEVRKLANWSDLSQWSRYIAGSDRLARQAVGGLIGGKRTR
jgi:site-specific recombinase XerD